MINDKDIGNIDYRHKTIRYQKSKFQVKTRTPRDELERKSNPNYQHVLIKKEDFKGDWPFYHDEVIIECRKKYCCVVTIDNKDYALNGCAKSRYNLASPHDAGMAILGKSLSPFIDMALKLGESITDK